MTDNLARLILLIGFAVVTPVGMYYRVRAHTDERLDRRQVSLYGEHDAAMAIGIEAPSTVQQGSMAVAENAVQRIDDVHAFPGHIACDPDSKSELVVPLHIDDKIVGVLDIDSPFLARFDATDQRGVERLCVMLLERLGAEGMTQLSSID